MGVQPTKIKMNFKYLTKGMLQFLVIDILSSIILMLMWNNLIAFYPVPPVNFVQSLGAIVIWDIFTTIGTARKSLAQLLDGEFEHTQQQKVELQEKISGLSEVREQIKASLDELSKVRQELESKKLFEGQVPRDDES